MKLNFEQVKNCKICGVECKNVTSLGAHIQFQHKDYNMKRYYNEYYKEDETEGKCKVCGAETKFMSLLEGYHEYCGKSCAHKTEQFITKFNEAISKKTDEQKKRWKEKSIETKVSKSSIGKAISDEELKNRRDQTIKHFTDYLTKANCTFISANEEKDRIYIKSVTFKCNKCQNETTYVRSLLDRYNRKEDYELCHFCNNRKSVSIPEKELRTFIGNCYKGNILLNDRNLLNKNELDIVLPEKKLAFEMDGLYWHNETCVDNNYHLNKTNECESKDYQLIHIFDDEWKLKREIVESRIKGLLGINTKIFARKCEVKEISYIDCKEFLNQNHIQGNCQSKYRYGLYYNNELVSVMTFGVSRFKKEWEMIRFCNKLNTNVIGGASKLFSHFLKQHTEIDKVITYADRRWSKGNLYFKMGFNKVSITEPSYFYLVKQERKNRIEFQKHKLVAMGYDKNKTEKQIMKELGYKRIYDCGTIKFEWNRTAINKK